MFGRRSLFHLLILLLAFSIPFLASAKTSNAKLNYLSGLVSNYLVENDAASLNVDVDVGLDAAESSLLAHNLSRRHYTGNFENAKAIVRKDDFTLIISPSSDSHLNPNSEIVLDCFEILVSDYGEVFASSSFIGMQNINIGESTIRIDGFASGYNAEFFEQTVGPFIIVPPSLCESDNVVINFDLSKGISSNSSYLSFLNSRGVLNSEVRLQDPDFQVIFDSAIGEYLSSSQTVDIIRYCLIDFSVIAFAVLVILFKPSTTVLIASFALVYLLFFLIGLLPFKTAVLGSLPTLVVLSELFGYLLISYIWKRKKRA